MKVYILGELFIFLYSSANNSVGKNAQLSIFVEVRMTMTTVLAFVSQSVKPNSIVFVLIRGIVIVFPN